MNDLVKNSDSFLLDPFNFRDIFGFGSFARLGNVNRGFVDKTDHYVVNINLPFDNECESLQVSVENNQLQISYDEKTDNVVAKGSYTYSIPEDVDIDTIDANLDNNRLTIKVMKKNNQIRKIDVKKG